MKRALMLSVLTVVGLSSTSGCQDDIKEQAVFQCPSREIYAEHVSELMERRCGMLDCHGNDFRPMRLYGEYGLRHPVERNRSGGAATTAGEQAANYFSVCSVEPERMQQVVENPGGSAVNTLLLVRKARGQERHKGGKVFEPFDDADRCVVGWLRGDVEESVAAACEAALARLP